jgi:hypothetical protein
MTIGGWITMIVSVGFVTVLLIWCIYKLMITSGEAEKMHGLEIETPDEKEAHHNN